MTAGRFPAPPGRPSQPLILLSMRICVSMLCLTDFSTPNVHIRLLVKDGTLTQSDQGSTPDAGLPLLSPNLEASTTFHRSAGHLPVLPRYSAIFFCRSAYSSHGIRQIFCSAAKCSSAFVRLPTMRYASPAYSCAPRWRGL